jgi:putative holliday junction resolvase
MKRPCFASRWRLKRGRNLAADPETAPVSVERFAAFDLGERRIGVAVTDALGFTVQPLLTIYCKTAKADLKSIGRILRRHGIAEAVVGNPLHMSGEMSPRARKSQELAAQIHAEYGIPVHLVDERLTTRAAHELLDESGQGRNGRKDRRDRRHIIDQVAAVLILETFLENRAQEAAREKPTTS